MSDPATIANLLQNTLVGDTNMIKSAQGKLLEMEKSGEFLGNLFMIVRQSTVPYNIQKAAIVYTMTYARHLFAPPKDQSRINQLAEGLLNFVAQATAVLSLRKQAASALEYVVLGDRKNLVRNILFNNFIPTIQANSKPDPIYIGLYLQVVLGSSQHMTRELIQFLRASFPLFAEYSIKLFSTWPQVSGEQNRQLLLNNLQMLKIQSYVFKLYAKKFPVVDKETSKVLYEDSLADLINVCLELELKGNDLNTPLIFYKNNCDAEICEYFHGIKADAICALMNCLRALVNNVKDAKALSSNRIIQKPMMIPLLVSSVQQILNQVPYHKIKSPSLIKLIEETYNTLIVAIRSNVYYSTFAECRKELIQGCLFRTLLLNAQDYDNYFFSPEEFVNSMRQVLDKDPTEFLRARKNQTGFEDPQGDIDNYDTLRTVAATLLSECCKYQDGVLSEIFTYCLGVLSGGADPDFPPTLLLLILGILQDATAARPELHEQVMMMLIQLVSRQKKPTKVADADELCRESKQQHISLAVILLILEKYISTAKTLMPELLHSISQIIHDILISPDVNEALKFITFDLVQVISAFDGNDLAVKFLTIFNLLMEKVEEDFMVERMLETLYELFKIRDDDFVKVPELTIRTVRNLSAIILKEVKREAMVNQLIINKSWNVITEICENEKFIPMLIGEIEEAILPLLPFADGEKFDYEENIFMMMSSFIRKAEKITQNQLQMFDIIPKLFYSTYHRQFGHSFETLQIFINYGGDILNNSPQAIRTIIEMAIGSFTAEEEKGRRRTEADNCEGVILLHSLMLACGKTFDAEMWMVVATSLHKRLEHPPVKTNHLKANLLAGLSLVLMMGFRFFSHEDNDVLLNKIIQNSDCLSVKYAGKVTIIVLSEMLAYHQLPFISGRIGLIFDCLCEVLQMEQHQNEIFQASEETSEDKDYDNLLTMIVNPIQTMDEIAQFKQKMMQLKQANPGLFQQGISALPELKKDFLREMFATTKIMNENRRIFKIKRQG